MNVFPFPRNREVCNIYGFGLTNAACYARSEHPKKKKLFTDALKAAEKKAIEKGYSFATLFMASGQESILRAPIEELGWTQVACAKNPVHTLKTVCYLFIKELTVEPAAPESIVQKLASKLSIGKGRKVAKE